MMLIVNCSLIVTCISYSNHQLQSQMDEITKAFKTKEETISKLLRVKEELLTR